MKDTGMCQNGTNCPRLATSPARFIRGLGMRYFCWMCDQALADLAVFVPRQEPKSGRKVSPLSPSAA